MGASEAPIEALKVLLKNVEGVDVEALSCQPLAGDASDRRYFRAAYRADGRSRQVVVMDILDVENICKSEEVTLYHDDSGELPFINVHRFLLKLGAPVPEVIHFDRERGLMLLEDLGDRLLLNEANGGDEDRRRQLYRQAVDELVRMQVRADGARSGSNCVAFEQTFAPDLLAWEFDHYLEYGIEQLHDRPIEPAHRAFLTECFRTISERIAALPRAFTHRDYHSRNLMLHAGRLVMIDFQDALWGPLQYDLASLLRDSYIDVGDTLREELIARYVQRYGRATGVPVDPVCFRRDFDLVAMQRNLKAAGRFVFIDRVKNNPNYLDSIPRTLRYVAGDFLRNAELAPILDVLVRYEPRLGELS